MTIERYIESGAEIARARSLSKRIKYVSFDELRGDEKEDEN